jgi:hypothetical protein
VSNPPRPAKNSDGQTKKPQAPPAPVSSPPGNVNPKTLPGAPGVMPAPAPVDPAGGTVAPAPTGPGAAPFKGTVTAPEQNPNATGNPLGNLTPTPTNDQRQVREQIAFKDMSPVEQAQTSQQQGLNPYMPLQMVQQQLQSSMAQGPSQGPVPTSLDGPFVPPGVQNFPDDMAHLHALMQQGMGPGSSPQEHEAGLNAHAIAKASINHAMASAQNDAGHAGATAALGGLIHHLGSTGQLPPPQDVAAHVAGLQAGGGPPNLMSSVIPPGYPQPANAPGMNPMPGSMPLPPPGNPPAGPPGPPPPAGPPDLSPGPPPGPPGPGGPPGPPPAGPPPGPGPLPPGAGGIPGGPPPPPGMPPGGPPGGMPPLPPGLLAALQKGGKPRKGK